MAVAQPPTVELDARTGYDFLACACAVCGELDDILAEDRSWLVQGRAALEQELGPDPRVDACGGFVTEVGRLIVAQPAIRTARDVVDAIDGLSDRDLIELIVGELLEDPELAGITRKAVDGDEGAFESLQARLESTKGHTVMAGTITELAPTTRQVARFWLPRYEKIEDRVRHMLERDAAELRGEDTGVDPFAFVEHATNGIRLVAEQRTRRIVLAPTYFGRPYNSMSHVGDTELIYYPIADTSLGSADRLTPPNSTVRLYRALGDESRLRILKLLAERDRYLTEIANALDLSKPTVKHHLAVLRSAGLTTVTEQGNMTYYTLRRDRAEEAGPELRGFLVR